MSCLEQESPSTWISASSPRKAARRSPRSHPAWLNIRRRAGNHTKDLTRCGLLFQRLRSHVARLLLVKQPHILDGDYRLVGKGFKQFNLPIRERTDLSSADMNSTNGNTFTE